MNWFRDKPIRVSKRPILVVGQNPGRQRKGGETKIVWEGNRSGDFIDELTKDLNNLYLTNVCNHLVLSNENVSVGVDHLRLIAMVLQPSKVVCLGEFAHRYVKQLMGELYPIVKLEHPSYVLRFNRDVEGYKKKLLKELT